jgi:hypothetical protein
LAPEGFTLDSHRKTGLVFRKATTNKRWTFLLVDQTRRLVASGILQAGFALTLPGKAVLPALASVSSVATFPPDAIVPEFQWSRTFASDSSSEFYLAADTITALTKIVFRRVDALLSASDAEVAEIQS